MLDQIQYILGLFHERLNHKKKALACYKQISEKSPVVHNRMGALLLSLGDYEQAAKHLKLALGKAGSEAMCAYRLGQALKKQGKLQEAYPYFLRSVRLRPGFEPWLKQYADCAVKGRVTVDEEDLPLLGARQGEYALVMGRQAESAGDIPGAVAFYASALRLEPGNEKAIKKYAASLAQKAPSAVTEDELALLGERRAKFEYEIGKQLEESGNPEGAFRHIASAVRLREDAPAPWVRRMLDCLLRRGEDQVTPEDLALLGDEHRARYEYRLGKQLEEAGDFDNAFRHIAQACHLRIDTPQVWWRRCLNCLLKQDIENISQEDISALGPLEGECWFQISTYYQKSFSFHKALPFLEKAVSLCPEKHPWLEGLGFLYEKLNRLEDAEKLFLKSYEMGSKNYKMYYHLGMISEKFNNDTAAKKYYTRACVLKKLPANYGAAPLHVLEGRWNDAALAYKAYFNASNANEEDANGHYLLGVVLEHSYDWEGAARQFENAISYNGTASAEWLIHLGSVYEKLGKIQQSAFAYRLARKNDYSPEVACRHANALRELEQYKDACDLYLSLYDCLDALPMDGCYTSFQVIMHRKAKEALVHQDYKQASLFFAMIRSDYLINPLFLCDGYYQKSNAFKINSQYIHFLDVFDLEEDCILYECHGGAQMACSPYAIFKYLMENAPKKYRHIWVINDITHVKEQYKNADNVQFVKRNTLVYAYYLATSKYLINNNLFPEWFIKRDEQVYCNTWHGTPLKALGAAEKNNPFGGYGNASRNFLHASWFIQPNKYTEDVMLDEYHIRKLMPGQSVVTGYPRQDLTINMPLGEKASLRNTLVGEDNRPILLYAPTWRNYESDDSQNDRINSVIRILSSTGYRVLFKGHYISEQTFSDLGVDIVPPWIETNELLAVADVLLTDFSSIGIDFLATGRPVIYYVVDSQEYIDGRGLMIPVEHFPGWICHDLEELSELVTRPHLDPSPLDDWQKELIAFDDGHATERVVDLLFNKTPIHSQKNSALLIYPGSLQPNGITTSCISLLEHIEDIDIYITANRNHPLESVYELQKRNSNVHVLPRKGEPYCTIEETYCLDYINNNERWFDRPVKEVLEKLFKRESKRLFGSSHFVTAINYEGYTFNSAGIMAHVDSDNHLVYLHNTMEDEYKEKLPQLSKLFNACNWYDKIVSVSNATHFNNREYMSSEWDLPREKFVYTDNLINYEKIIALAQEKLPEGAKDLFSSRPVFLTIGRLSAEKDHAKLIRAFSKVHRAFPDAKLMILGKGYLYAELTKLIEELSLKESVIMMGLISNPYPWLKLADCFVLSSNHEGQPIVLLEALALQKPIISTDILSTHDLLLNTGAILAENSEEALSEAMTSCIKNGFINTKFNIDEYNQQCILQFYCNTGCKYR